jgi:hypothetical protein
MSDNLEWEWDAAQLERFAAEANSRFELDPRGGPPVVVINMAAQKVITAAFKRKVYWAGITLGHLNAALLLGYVQLLKRRVSSSARANLSRLVDDLLTAIEYKQTGGCIAIVIEEILSPADVNRTKREERGHLIQHAIGGGETSRHAPVFDLYDRPETQRFISNLGSDLYDSRDRDQIVSELAMKINNGEWRRYGLTADDAKAWMTAYFYGVRQEHGHGALLMFRPILNARVAKAAFRAAQPS